MTNKEAIEELKKVDTLDISIRLCEAHYMSIKALEVLDKIREEIGKELSMETISDNSQIVSDVGIGLELALSIIDKYKVGSEEVHEQTNK